MIIFLYGPDSYRSKKKLQEIISHYKDSHKSGLNLMHVDAGKVEFNDLYNSINTASMFAETKLVIIKNLFFAKSFQEEFLEEIKDMQSGKDVIVVYEEGEVDQRLKIFKTLTKECKSQEFALLDARNLRQWIQKEMEQQGQKMNMDAEALLLAYVGNDLWRLENEIKKLMHYRANSVIKKDDVELLVRPNIENDIFKTIDALAQKNKPQALSLLQKHIDGGDNPLYLLSMVAYQFKNLLMVKELAEKGLMYASIVKMSGLHPFVVKKNYFACQQFSFQELKNMYHTIFQIDLDIKTGKLDPEMALELLVSQV